MCYGINVIMMGWTLARMREIRNVFQKFGRKSSSVKTHVIPRESDMSILVR